MASTTDALGNTARYTYDKNGRKLKQILPDPDGIGPLYSSTTNYTYDDVNDRQYVTDTLGSGSSDTAHTTTTTYDKFGRIIKVESPDPDGDSGPLGRSITQYQYDANGNLYTVTDPRGHVTTYVYDGLNRKTTQTEFDPDSAGPLSDLTTCYYYDANSNLRYVVNPGGTSYSDTAHTTQYQYDNLNRKTKEIRMGETTVYGYDQNGNVISVTDPRGNTSWYGYDKLGRQCQATDAEGSSAGDPAHTTTTWFDAAGNTIAVTDALGRSTFYTYDAANRKIRETVPAADGSVALRPTTDTTPMAISQPLSIRWVT